MTASADADWARAVAAAPRFQFGDERWADFLGALVVSGDKTATCALKSAYDAEGGPPAIGDLAVFQNAAGRDWGVIEYREVETKRFADVDAAFAHDEGEGDRSRAHWERVHRAFFSEYDPAFCDDTLIVCLRFRLRRVFPDVGPRGPAPAHQR